MAETEDIRELSRCIRACRRCLEQPLTSPLPHEPRPVLQISSTARLAICGQAPGTRVHASGVPFSDPSGDRLLAWTGLDRATFYDAERVAIIPMGFCFPGLDDKGGDLPPRKECAGLWHERLFSSLDQLELILLVGRYAQSWHLGERAMSTVTQTVKNWRRYLYPDPAERPAAPPRRLPLPHPSWRNNAWIKANPWFEGELIAVLREEVAAHVGGATC